MAEDIKTRFNIIDTFVQTLEADMPVNDEALKLLTRSQCDRIKQEIEIHCVLYPLNKDAFIVDQIQMVEGFFEKCFILSKNSVGIRRKQVRYLAMYIYDVILFLYEFQD